MTSETATRIDPDAAFRELGEQIEGAMERLGVPGVAVGVTYEGKDYVAGFGVTNVDHPQAVEEVTLFQIGSISKTFTATVAMRLVEAESLDLDAPIRTYLPDLTLADESVAAAVTMRHLFSHTGGWEGDFFHDAGRGDDALGTIVARMSEIPQLTPLGAIWSYSNSGFYLAGRVIEVITGKPYELAVKEMVLDPLGLDHSFFFPEEVMIHSFAVGHNVVDGKPQVARPWALPRTAHPAGGLSSSAPDLLRYARFHMGDGRGDDGTRLLSRESLEQMQTGAVPANDEEKTGVAWFIREVEGVKIVGHGGGTNGQISAFLFAPNRGFAFTILTNANRGGELNEEIETWALQRYLGVTRPQPAPIEATEEELVQYTGRYSATLTVFDLSLRDGRLIMSMGITDKFPADEPPPSPPPAPAALYAPDRIIVLEGPEKDVRGEFVRDPDGSIAWLRFGGRLHRREA